MGNYSVQIGDRTFDVQAADPETAAHAAAKAAGTERDRTAGESFGMGVRGILRGIGGTLNAIGAPLSAPINAIAQATVGHDVIPSLNESTVDPLADKMGLIRPNPNSPSDQLITAINEGGAAALTTGGLGGLVAKAPGVAGMLGKALAGAPIKNIVSGAASGAAEETARQHGAGPVGQTLAGLAAGFGAYGTMAAFERGAATFGPKTAKQVATHPPEEVFDEQDHLTENGREVAARAEVDAPTLKAAYEEAAKPVEPAPDAPPEAPQEPAQTAQAAELPPEPVHVTGEAVAASEPMPESASGRLSQASSEGVQLTKGQATQDFATQDAEQTLLAQQAGPGAKARQFKDQQQAQIQEAVNRFQDGFGDSSGTPADRGSIVQKAIADLRDQGKAGVSKLYEMARAAAERAGEAGSNLINLDTKQLLAKMRELFIDESVPDQTRRALKQLAAKYGLIGESPKTVEGETSVILRDSNGEPSGKVSFTGPQEPLTVVNAEPFRQKVSALYDALGGRGNAQESLKPVLDDAVETALSRAAEQGEGSVGDAFKQARAAHVVQKQTFEGGDVVQNAIKWKKGQKGEFATNPENVIRSIFGAGKDAVSNLKRVKAVLLSKPTAQSLAAWKALQAHAIGEIFDKALSPRGEISGARLDSAMKKFGDDKLKIVLAKADYNQLQKLRRIIKDATVPLPNTTNPSGSAFKIMTFLGHQGAKLGSVVRFVPGLGHVAQAGVALVKHAHAAGQAEAVLKGVREFSPADAARADRPNNVVHLNGAEFARAFVDSAKSDAMLRSVVTATENVGAIQPKDTPQ